MNEKKNFLNPLKKYNTRLDSERTKSQRVSKMCVYCVRAGCKAATTMTKMEALSSKLGAAATAAAAAVGFSVTQ